MYLICLICRLKEDGCDQVKRDGVVMSALPHQIAKSCHLAHLGITSVASQHNEMTKLLALTMSIVQSDREGALESVRSASALREHADYHDADSEKSTRRGLTHFANRVCEPVHRKRVRGSHQHRRHRAYEATQ